MKIKKAVKLFIGFDVEKFNAEINDIDRQVFFDRISFFMGVGLAINILVFIIAGVIVTL